MAEFLVKKHNVLKENIKQQLNKESKFREAELCSLLVALILTHLVAKSINDIAAVLTDNPDEKLTPKEYDFSSLRKTLIESGIQEQFVDKTIVEFESLLSDPEIRRKFLVSVPLVEKIGTSHEFFPFLKNSYKLQLRYIDFENNRLKNWENRREPVMDVPAILITMTLGVFIGGVLGGPAGAAVGALMGPLMYLTFQNMFRLMDENNYKCSIHKLNSTEFTFFNNAKLDRPTKQIPEFQLDSNMTIVL